MSTFKCALRIAAKHPLYLVIYVVWLSLMGVFMGLSVTGPQDATTYEPFDGRVAVIDRDGSELSRGLVAYLGRTYEQVDVEDEPFALQDAVAKGEAHCVLIIPAGFSDALLGAARGEGAEPELACAYGQMPTAGALVSQAGRDWCSLVQAAAALEPEASASDLVKTADVAAEQRAEVTLQGTEATGAAAEGLRLYLSFEQYSIGTSMVVCAGVVLLTLGKGEVRRRTAASPVPPMRFGAEQIAACILLALLVWAWTYVLARVAFGDAMAAAGPGQLALAFGALLAYALVALAIAFLLAQMGVGEEGVNACGNILMMLMTFLGGAWMPLSLMGEAVQAVARFVPSFWTSEAIGHALASPAVDGALLVQVGGEIGVVLLFATAIAAVGLALGRARHQRGAL